jgi:hypothetical protein
MEPTDLTCAHCGTTWKVIKADGPITCPNCKAVVGGGAPAASVPNPIPSPPAMADPAPTAIPAPARATAAGRPRPAVDLSDADDPGIGAPPPLRIPDVGPVRRRWHPLVTVAVILGLIMLVPVALVACLFAVCSVMFR